MESRRYPFQIDRVTIYWTVLHFVGFAAVGVLLFYLYIGGFFSVWFTSFIVAIILLMVLSVPRAIHLDDRSLVVDSILDVTEIELDRITSIKKISPRKIRWVLPIFGGCGLFGYYGHFFDLKHFRHIQIYATEWRYLVEVVDIFDEHYYLSCRDRDALISEIRRAIED